MQDLISAVVSVLQLIVCLDYKGQHYKKKKKKWPENQSKKRLRWLLKHSFD